MQETQEMETQIWSLGREDSPGVGNGNPLGFLSGELHRQKSLTGYRPWNHKQSDMTEHAHAFISGHLRQLAVHENAIDNTQVVATDLCFFIRTVFRPEHQQNNKNKELSSIRGRCKERKSRHIQGASSCEWWRQQVHGDGRWMERVWNEWQRGEYRKHFFGIWMKGNVPKGSQAQKPFPQILGAFFFSPSMDLISALSCMTQLAEST